MTSKAKIRVILNMSGTVQYNDIYYHKSIDLTSCKFYEHFMNIVRDIDFNWHHVKFSVRIHEYCANVSDPWFLKEHILHVFVKADLGKDLSHLALRI